MYGDRIYQTDLRISKAFRTGGTVIRPTVSIYNLFNADTATGYEDDYTAFLVNGQWVTDNPATPEVEVNEWGNITQIVNPRFMRLSLTFDF